MITRMEVDSEQPGAPDLPLGGFMPNTDPIQIRNIEGLGPVKAELATTPFATGRGELYQGISTPKRNIVLTLGLNPNWASQSMSSLRRLLYTYFTPEYWTTLRFFSDEYPTVRVRGVVESFEPNIFSQDPEIQVSILCPKPDFIDIATTVLTGVVDGTDIPIDYPGTVSSGFELKIESSDDLSSYTGDITIKNTVRGEEQIFKIEAVTVDTAMYLDLNTVRTARYVYNVAVSDESAMDILAKIGHNPIWPELLPGPNVLSITTDTPGLAWTLGYFKRFGGL